MKTTDINWGSIHRALVQWRKNLQSDNEDGTKEPSVTTVAEHYSHDPWAILVSTILSLRTKDEVTLITSKRLLAKAPGPKELAAMRVDHVAKLA